MTEQLSIFDIPIEETEPKVQENEQEEVFEIGDRVKVKDLDEVDFKMSVEDAYFLKAYSGKKGKIVDIHRGKTVSYKIQLNNGELIYAYARELILLG
jgi:ribosomal protein L21E